MVPKTGYGLRCMSMSFLLPKDAPATWRGPMVMGALETLITKTAWGPLDLLVVDMPPGTGDVHLTTTQRLRLSGAVIVSTPQVRIKVSVRFKMITRKPNTFLQTRNASFHYIIVGHCTPGCPTRGPHVPAGWRAGSGHRGEHVLFRLWKLRQSCPYFWTRRRREGSTRTAHAASGPGLFAWWIIWHPSNKEHFN